MIRGCSIHVPCFFEDLTPRDTFHYVPKDVVSDDGAEVLGVRYEYVCRKSNQPFTPQSGIDTRINDLSFMFKSNINVNHEPSYLSIAKSGNPYSAYLEIQKVADAFESEVNKQKSSNKDNKE